MFAIPYSQTSTCCEKFERVLGLLTEPRSAKMSLLDGR